MKNKKKSFAEQPLSRFFTPATQATTGTLTRGRSKPKPAMVALEKPVAVTVETRPDTPAVTIPDDLVAKLRAQKPEVKSRRVQVVLQPSFYNRAESVAKQLDVSVNELVRMSLEHLMNSLQQ